jgi:aspartate-semialdehyde dehydrogenase
MTVQLLDADLDCRVLFSTLPSSVTAQVEERHARAGTAVFSNASAHRLDADVPLLVPEANSRHAALIEVQRRRRGWPGLIATSANCSTTQLVLALKPLHETFGIRALSIVTLQAISGAGYPGVASLDILGNVVPYIGGEEKKLETETQKMLGQLAEDEISPAQMVISAQCNRVPVRDGHLECLSIGFVDRPEIQPLIEALETFRGPPEVARLPSSPALPIVVRREPDRPQPLLDRDGGRGTSVSVGRVRPCPVLDYKMVLLGHNTLRGAAGGSIHNTELLVRQGYVA